MQTLGCRKRQKEGWGQDVGGGICLLSRSEQLPLEFLYLLFEIFYFLLDNSFLAPPFLSVMGILNSWRFVASKMFQAKKPKKQSCLDSDQRKRQGVPGREFSIFFRVKSMNSAPWTLWHFRWLLWGSG